MPAQVKRKIMRHGTSAVAVIPKAYRDYNHVDPGTSVTMLYDSLLLIIPEGRENLLKDRAELIDKLLGGSSAGKDSHLKIPIKKSS